MYIGLMQTGNFGRVREAYVAARRGVPSQVLDLFWQLVSKTNPRILDLGCGTGISTRQLAGNPDAEIIGGDIDAGMLEKAREMPIPNVKYVAASARALPFESEEFDAVTAFSAFHWFRDDQSLREIRRVLKPGGIFFVSNNNDIGGFWLGFREKGEVPRDREEKALELMKEHVEKTKVDGRIVRQLEIQVVSGVS